MSSVCVAVVSGVALINRVRITHLVDGTALTGIQKSLERLQTPVAFPADEQRNKQSSTSNPPMTCGNTGSADNDSQCNDDVRNASHA